jgi:hypothetical protein
VLPGRERVSHAERVTCELNVGAVISCPCVCLYK